MLKMMRFAAFGLLVGLGWSGPGWGFGVNEPKGDFTVYSKSSISACSIDVKRCNISTYANELEGNRAAWLGIVVDAGSKSPDELSGVGAKIDPETNPWEDKCELWVGAISYEGKISNSTCDVENLEAALTTMNALFTDGSDQEIYIKLYTESRPSQSTKFVLAREGFDPKFFYEFEKESGYPDMLKLLDSRFGIKTKVEDDGRVVVVD